MYIYTCAYFHGLTNIMYIQVDQYHADKVGWTKVSEMVYDQYRMSRGAAQGVYYRVDEYMYMC